MTLALLGGEPLNTRRFEWNSSIGEEEKRAVMEVLDSRVLSDFYGSPGDRFLGGPRVRALERKWAERFGVRHAVAMNSATSGLYAAVGAIGIEPGDEVILPPYTMSATVAAILGYHAIPVFADIEPDHFCLDPQDVERRITDRTRAIMAVNLFGQPADLEALRAVARRHSLKLIEDNAQAPGARLSDRFAGTWGEIGVFSLNCHKAIQCGEGGVAVTDDDELALRLQLIRNHAESVVGGMGVERLDNMLGFNFRMTEIESAIAAAQLDKLDGINARRIELAARFDERLGVFPFLRTPRVRPKATHVYYLYMLRYDPSVLGIPREIFLKALNAEGYHAVGGYVTPLYLLPLFQKRIVFGRRGYPFIGTSHPPVSYVPGLCPVTERLNDHEIFYPDLIRRRITPEDIDTFARAVDKVASHAHLLK